jgi:hypothetical protein
VGETPTPTPTPTQMPARRPPADFSLSPESGLDVESHNSSSCSPEDIDKEEKGGVAADAGEQEEEDAAVDENDPNYDGYGYGGGGREEGTGTGTALGVRATRASTKSSWKDPGPPPDGGWTGWTQGVYLFLLYIFYMCAWVRICEMDECVY